MRNRNVILAINTIEHTVYAGATMRDVLNEIGIDYDKNRKLKLPGTIEYNGYEYRIQKIKVCGEAVKLEIPTN